MKEYEEKCLEYFRILTFDELGDKAHFWIAGGCVRDFFTSDHIGNDVDLFFPNKYEFDRLSSWMLTAMVDGASLGILLHENDRVLKVQYRGIKYDLVKRHFGSMKETITNFDFTVCAAAVSQNDIVYDDRFFVDLARKSLHIVSLPYPYSSLKRLQKYVQKGYHMCPENMARLIDAIREYRPAEMDTIDEIEFDPLSGGGRSGLFAGMD